MVSVLTTIFAPDAETATVALGTLRHTAAAFPDAERFACVDLASEHLVSEAEAGGWRLIQLSAGHPPRMIALLVAGLIASTGDLVWTVEMDARIGERSRAIAEGLALHDGIAAVECNAVNERGRLTEPTHLRALNGPAWNGDARVRDCVGVSFNCTCWRREALSAVNWSLVPMIFKADSRLCEQLAPQGWKFLVALDAPVYHIRGVSTRALVRWKHASQQHV